MRIGIPQEIHAGERRVATTPEVAGKLIKLGFTVALQKGAGIAADLADEAYSEVGVEIVEDVSRLWADSDIVLKVRAPEPHPGLGCHEVDLLREGATLVSFLWPAQNPELMDRLAGRKATVLAMDSVPRISRAQKLDALSSMANIAGYRAVIEAAQNFGRFFTGQVTAAGKVPPAKVFVIGAGVAGLAAIGAANGLGAIVRAMDTRPEVKDQVKSLGAEFVSVDYQEEGEGTGGYAKVMSEGYQKAQAEAIAKQCREVDVVITTALIPGKPAPKLITEEMVQSMQDGSVIVDLASEQGGNCACTVPGQVVQRHGVSIVGYTDLPSRMARQSSQLYATNLLRLLEELCTAKDGLAVVNMEDEMIRGATVVKDGEITWPPPAPRLSAAPPAGAKPAAAAPVVPEKKPLIPPALQPLVVLIAAGLALAWLGTVAPAAFMSHLMVFVLACFVGYMVIWNVTPALHTPLMSVTNAISSIIAIGALIQVSAPGFMMTLLAGIALILTTINMVGGFAVTQRMLRMFRRSE
ncbi:MAG: Re/Si-specific NAD(P)(+) transhydrogenase subunit alpha [Gammaproteobacteria bacterium]|nr:Re/Si-specific NAD(P)(+) transhydrogenase subunit alpha [Gammaproteobacteria bacterium]